MQLCSRPTPVSETEMRALISSRIDVGFDMDSLLAFYSWQSNRLGLLGLSNGNTCSKTPCFFTYPQRPIMFLMFG